MGARMQAVKVKSLPWSPSCGRRSFWLRIVLTATRGQFWFLQGDTLPSVSFSAKRQGEKNTSRHFEVKKKATEVIFQNDQKNVLRMYKEEY